MDNIDNINNPNFNNDNRVMGYKNYDGDFEKYAIRNNKDELEETRHSIYLVRVYIDEYQERLQTEIEDMHDFLDFYGDNYNNLETLNRWYKELESQHIT